MKSQPATAARTSSALCDAAAQDVQASAQRSQVRLPAGAEIVENADTASLCEEPFDQMGADKAGAARDQTMFHLRSAHARLLFLVL